MKRTTTILLLITFMAVQALGQQVSFHWAEKAFIHNSAAKLQGKAMLVDADDNVFVFGVHASSPNAQFKNKDMILAKFNAEGKRLWYEKYPTETFAGHGSYRMYWDDQYNIIVAGEMNTIFGSDTLHKYGSSLNATIGIVKFDSTGNYIWSTQVDADVDDEFDFVQLGNGDFALRGEGTVTYKPDSSLSLTNEDFLVTISASGTVERGMSAPYQSVPGVFDIDGPRRKIFANGPNVASAVSGLMSNSPAPGVTSVILFNELAYPSGNSTNQVLIRQSGMGVPHDYQYDATNQYLYMFANTNSDQVILNETDTIHTTLGHQLIVQYDLANESLLGFQDFSASVILQLSHFSETDGLACVWRYIDSCRNYSIDSTYYEPAYIPDYASGQDQYLLINFDDDLSYNYWTQYATSVGSLSLFDLTFGPDGSLYGTTDGSAESYFDTLVLGTQGNAEPTGFLFKVANVPQAGGGNTSTRLQASEDESIVLYPNPSEGIVHLRVPGVFTYQVFSMEGKRVASGAQIDGKTLDLQHLKPGVYTIMINKQHALETKKLVLH